MIDNRQPQIPFQLNFLFKDERLGIWLANITDFCARIEKGLENANITVVLPDNLNPSTLKPVHLVTLACLITSLSQTKYKNGKIQGSEDIINYLRDKVHLPEYFDTNVFHVKGDNNYDLNLWKVSSENSPIYSQKVAEYLRNRYFKNKDLSGLKVVLDELYANISDHSKSNGIAYSYIKYDEKEEKINIAFCDFGVGIRGSLESNNIKIDRNVIEYATRKGVSAKSNSHNKGFGLDTVVTSIFNTGNPIKIVSGNELFLSYGDYQNFRTWILEFYFPGTLIYFDLPINTFEDLEYVEFEF